MINDAHGLTIAIPGIGRRFMAVAAAGLLLVSGQTGLQARAKETRSLAGTWRFELDRADIGEQERWFDRELPESLELPGSLQEQGFGDVPTSVTEWTGNVGVRTVDWIRDPRYAPYTATSGFKMPFLLTPERHYVGVAWYQRVVEIPPAWNGRRTALLLERPHWETALWVNGESVGKRNGLGVPHEYDLTSLLKPGLHRLTLRVDNRVHIPVGVDAHSVSDQTQSNWNGVIGRMELTARDPVWLDDVQVYPDVPARKARVVVSLGNTSGQAGRGTIKATAESFNTSRTRHFAAAPEVDVVWDAKGGRAEFEMALGPDTLLWDEFSPALYRLTLDFNGGRVSDRHEVTFGMRELKAVGTQFVLNGRPVYMRGTLECAIFPRTGYPPTDAESWKTVLRAARAHGLNHLRFHSWCPPEAAFEAADEMGFYLQAECSGWSFLYGDGTALDLWTHEETERMLRAYGNHPSFLFMAVSNEPGREDDVKRYMAEWATKWKELDGRRMYTGGSGYPEIPEQDFHVTPGTRGVPEKSARGETTADHRDFVSRNRLPVVFHEIGQYSAYPNFAEIEKYTGSLKPRNFEILRDFLERGGMLDQARDFLMASGRLQALCYKEEIEANLRTPGMGGFALLDLHDFPGQGTSLIGVLDAFWESKGYITPEEYRRFCGDTVPLARFEKRCFTTTETFSARIEVSHFGPTDLDACLPSWRVSDTSGSILATGKLALRNIPTGTVTHLGEVRLPLTDLKEARQLNLEVTLPGNNTPANDWDFWVYPARLETAPPTGVHVVTSLDQDVMTSLTAGARVLLMPPTDRIAGDTLGTFTPVFWSRATFPDQKNHTLGILCDPAHPALQKFPTDFHSNWQWQDLVQRSRPVIMDNLPKELRPVVQVIDDPFLARKLGLVFEARVGRGKLLFCAIDLERELATRPAAGQLRTSLLHYMAEDTFNPAISLTPGQLSALMKQENVHRPGL